MAKSTVVPFELPSEFSADPLDRMCASSVSRTTLVKQSNDGALRDAPVSVARLRYRQ
jgi:hypothetical protein